jgi:hypothetical protein
MRSVRKRTERMADGEDNIRIAHPAAALPD